MAGHPNQPIIIKRKKVVKGGGHHGGAWKVAMFLILSRQRFADRHVGKSPRMPGQGHVVLTLVSASSAARSSVLDVHLLPVSLSTPG